MLTSSQKQDLAKQLTSEQSLIGTFIGSLSGAVPGYILYVMLVSETYWALIFTIIPGVAIGYGARFVGKGISSSHRFTAAFVAAAGLVFLWFLGLSTIMVILSLPTIAVAATLAGRRLTREQSSAMFSVAVGAVDAEKGK